MANYLTRHKEALAVVWNFRHFKHLNHGSAIHVRTNHSEVVELFDSKYVTGKLPRWSSIIQGFNPSFTFLPGKANVVADALLRHIACLHALRNGNFKEQKDQKDDSFFAPTLLPKILRWYQLSRLPIPLTVHDRRRCINTDHHTHCKTRTKPKSASTNKYLRNS